MRQYVARLLSERYEVEAVADGQTALTAVHQQRPDLVLSDVMLPRLDGFGLLRALRHDPSLKTLPVILLSARAGEESRVEGLERGADDYLIKPFSARELSARVQAHLDLAHLRQESHALKVRHISEDRKRAEARLRESEERWRAVFDNSAVGIALTDLNGRFLATNSAYQRMVGYSADEFQALHFIDITHEDDRDRNRGLITELIEGTRDQFQIEKRYWRKDGTLIWVRNSVSLAPGSENMSGFEPVRFEHLDPKVMSKRLGEVRHGTRGGRPDVRLLGGWFAFESRDSALLVSLLPSVVHVRSVERLSVLVRIVGEEASERRSGRDLVLTRLVEVLLIEALRSTPGEDAPPGLLRGLADARIAPAIRQMHSQLARGWTVAQLARTAAVSRSAFFERFTRIVGVAPMEYLLAWRMAVAKDLLRRVELTVGDVAERVGYSSASTFSAAFSRYVGAPPSRYAATLSGSA